MIYFDLLVYFALFALLISMIRVTPTELVQFNIDGERLTGRVLRSTGSLNNKIGLLNTANLQQGDGLLLVGVNSIHTKGMHFPIDVLFLNEQMRIISIHSNIQPNQKKLKGPRGTKFTLEFGGGTIQSLGQRAKMNAQCSVSPTPSPATFQSEAN